MISRTVIGRSFGGLARYLVEGHKGQDTAKQAELLSSAGVRTDTVAHMVADFNLGRQLHPELGKAVWHTSLSFNPDDAAKLTSEKMCAIAEDYMQEMKLTGTQYAIIRHRDRPGHEHVHIIANRVADNGRTISDSHSFLRSKKVLANLIERHELTPPQGLRVEKQHPAHLEREELAKHEIKQALGQALATAPDRPALLATLRAAQISAQEYTNKAGAVTGISFEKDGYAFKGSAIARGYSLAGIEKQVQANQAAQQVAQEQAAQQAAAQRAAAVPPVEQKWASAYQQYAQQQQAHNAAVLHHNAPVEQVMQLFAQGPTVEGLHAAVQLTAGVRAHHNLHQALTAVLQNQTRHQQNVQKYAAERVELEKQAGGWLGLGLGKKAEEAREKLALLRTPPHTLPEKHYTWALYARMATEPPPPIILQPASFLQAEAPVLLLKDYAAQREAHEQAQRQAVVHVRDLEHAAKVGELLRVNGARIGEARTGAQGVQLDVSYNTQDAQLKTISWALDQVERRQLGTVAETAAERAERQAPGQREVAQRQAQQARRSERGRGGAELGLG